MKILIIKLGALGDVINTIPLAIQLKQHLNASIHWLVAPLSYPIIAEHECVDRAIVFDRSSLTSSIPRLVSQLRSQEYEVVLDLQRILKSGLFTLAASAKRRIGFDKQRCKEMSWLLPFERIPSSDPHAHMLHQYLEFAKYLGVSLSRVEWRIKVPNQAPVGLPEAFIVLNICATKPANRWTIDGFASLAQSIMQQYHMPSLLTGGKEDIEMAKGIESLAGGSVLNLVGRTTLKELMSVINAARAVVTCDTGPMHLAVALGKRVVALFGPSDHRRTGPFRGEVIRKEMSCAPCNKKNCNDPICMSAIQIQDVLEGVSAYLKV